MKLTSDQAKLSQARALTPTSALSEERQKQWNSRDKNQLRNYETQDYIKIGVLISIATRINSHN